MSLSFLAEENVSTEPPWKVAIIDDEEDVHTITKMALKRFELEGRKLEFIHAYSAEEGKKILKEHKDIALIFLDVVMETDDAGLELAKWIRTELENHFVRVVLRTGQPGQAPEEEVIVNYDINDYKEKTELDRKKLFTTVFSALRAYRDIIAVEEARKYQELYRSGLERVINSTSDVLNRHTLKQFFNGLLQQVLSILRLDTTGIFVQLSGLGLVYSDKDIEIIAQTHENNTEELSKSIEPYIEKAIQQKRSIKEDDVLIGYFPSQGEKVSLLCLKGIQNLDELDLKLLEIFSSNVGLAFDNLLLNQEITETQEELIYRLGDVVESRSKEAGNHIRRMSEVSYLLAKELGLDEEQADLLKKAAPMHDIGKIATPDSVLLKPGRLDDDEMKVMKMHSAVGYKILSGSTRPILQSAAIISQQHHEKYDGTGYPDGIGGDDIHIFARIVAVADVFDALTHKRCYKEAWPREDVVKFMEEGAGSHMDPNVVEKLLANIDTCYQINDAYKD